MLVKTRGLVLRTVDYSDSSIIVKIYTENFGIQSYLVRGAKRKRSPIRASLFQPLAPLELVVYRKEKSGLQTIKEIKPEYVFTSISFDPVKTALLFFINEVSLRCLVEEEPDPELFRFLHETIQVLDETEKNFSNLHLVFLMRFSRFLGFYPGGHLSREQVVFDLREGKFSEKEPFHPDYVSGEACRLIGNLMRTYYYSLEQLKLTGNERKQLLDILLRYYDLHSNKAGSIQSHKVLEQLLN